MKLEIIENKRNVLLERNEIKFRILQENVTPKESEVFKQIASAMNVKEDQIVIDTIHQEFGKLESTGSASVYDKPVKKKEKKAKAAEKPKEGK